MPNELLAHIASFVATGTSSENSLQHLVNLACTSSRFAQAARDTGRVHPLRDRIRQERLEIRRQQAADERAEWGCENDGW